MTSGFSSIALAFAAIGLFAILTYMVASRKRELALRIALGAPHATVVRGIVNEMLRLVLLGVQIGVVASVAVVRLTGAFIYGIEPTDPYFIGLAVTLVTLVGLIAVYTPARRASRVDPGIVLRAD